MSTTTQILFNSPALHSLKRDQLVKLCKIHAIKASGKNVELIEKLKQHAQTLPKDSPLRLAARFEETRTAPVVPPGLETEGDKKLEDDKSNGGEWHFQMPRPSEQWEVVMESIEELEESSSQGTLSSLRTLGGGAGEFGTGSSKCTFPFISSHLFNKKLIFFQPSHHRWLIDQGPCNVPGAQTTKQQQ